MDGKPLRGARRLGAQDGPRLSACGQQHPLVLGQPAVPDTTKERGARGPCLATLPRAGETVTFDAAFTQGLVARQVVAQGGAYLLVVNANPPPWRRAGPEAPTRPRRRPCRQYGQARTVELAHGRLEERVLTAAAAPPTSASRPRSRCSASGDGASPSRPAKS
jgi:hypothetical protein